MKRRDTATADLFAIPRPAAPVPGSMDYRAHVTALVGEMLRDAAVAGLDRYEVATRASRLAGRDISKAMLDGYTAESREEFNAPLWLAPVLETVCSSTLLAEWHAAQRGGRLLVGAATLDAEIGRLEREREVAGERLRQLKEMRRTVR
jgi:hypothetical protein